MQDILFHIYVCLYTHSYKMKYFLSPENSLILKKKIGALKEPRLLHKNIFSGWVFQFCLELCSSAFPYINSVCHHPPSLKELPYINENKLTFPEASEQVFFLWITVIIPLMPKLRECTIIQSSPFYKGKTLWTAWYRNKILQDLSLGRIKMLYKCHLKETSGGLLYKF